MSHQLFNRTLFAVLLGALPLCAHAADRHTDTLALQVALDRAGFSPGIIDGNMGQVTRQALRGFQEARGHQRHGTHRRRNAGSVGRANPTDRGRYDYRCGRGRPIPGDTRVRWRSGRNSTGSTMPRSQKRSPRISHNARQPCARSIPAAISLQAARSSFPRCGPPPCPAPAQRDGTRCLASLASPRLSLVPARWSSTSRTGRSACLISTGALVAQFPATLGSEHDPLPIGEWKIRGVSPLPSFNYDPELFWDADAKDVKAKLPPGPNGPVGVVWIDLSKEHYGNSRNARTPNGRPHRIAWLHPVDQLGCREARPDGSLGHARDPAGIGHVVCVLA